LEIEQFVTPGLGDSSYLVASDGEAAVIDPQRDVGPVLAAAEALGLRIRHVLETHVHNDYVSGALELRASTGAQVAGPGRGAYAFPHVGLGEGDEIRVGSTRLMAVETPGHTPEHLTYLARVDGRDEPEAAFTGGSLIVGSAGRTDLLGASRAGELAHAQYRSLQRLKRLPGRTRVFPTHGAGSFCASTSPSGERSSSIEAELRQNPALADVDEETFVAEQSSRLLAFPTYYRHMAPINRSGPRVLGPAWPAPVPLSAQEVESLGRRGTWIVDGRKRQQFAAAHLPGSVNVELNDEFASYVGWVVPFGEPVALVVPEPEATAAARAARQLLGIGYEAIAGYLEGGVQAWVATGLPVRSYPTATVDDLCEAYRSGGVEPGRIVDVRQQVEWDDGHIAGSVHLFVGDLPSRVDKLPRSGELWMACRSGHRAALATSLADAAGLPVRLVVRDGVPAFLGRCRPDRPEAAAPAGVG
jgi:hydroxyacylglutathione hydrolase